MSVCTSQWPRYNHDNANSSANLEEKIINKHNVRLLRQIWSHSPPDGEFLETEPIIFDGIVYTYTNAATLTAYHVIDGSQIWQTKLLANGQPTTNSGSSPTVVGSFLYVATNNIELFALNRFTGAIIWQTIIDQALQATKQGEVQASITEIEGLVIVTMSNADETTTTDFTLRPSINAFNALTGQRIWSQIFDSVNGFGIGSWSTPSYDRKLKLLFIGTTNANTPPAGPFTDSLQARNYLTGDLVWNQQYTTNDVYSKAFPNGIGNTVFNTDRDVGASPNLFTICHNGKKLDLVGASSKAGVYRAFKRSNGEPFWNTILTTTPSILGNPSAAYANGIIYVAGNNDPIPSVTPELQIAFQNNPSLDTLLQVTNASFNLITGFITALDACNGQIKWTAGFPSSIFGAPVYANGLLYVTWINGNLRILDAQTGQLLSNIITPAAINVPPPFNTIITNQALSVSAPVVDGRVFLAIGNESIPFGSSITVYSF